MPVAMLVSVATAVAGRVMIDDSSVASCCCYRALHPASDAFRDYSGTRFVFQEDRQNHEGDLLIHYY